MTSLDGAALRDIIKVLSRRHPNAHLVIRPARVQGEGAAAEIADAVRSIARVPGVDVVIVGRGGGSAEDLVAFNEEPVARAIAGCPVPVVTAVGHEVDFTIADFVADVRAPTPSAAAEMVVAAKEEFCARIDRQSRRLRAAMRAGLDRRRTRSTCSAAAAASPACPPGSRCADVTPPSSRISCAASSSTPSRAASASSGRCACGSRRATCAGDSPRSAASSTPRPDGCTPASAAGTIAPPRGSAPVAGRLESLSPLAVLGRGYAVCWNDDRTAIIRTAATVTAGDRVHVTLHDGELNCVVESTDRTVDEPRRTPNRYRATDPDNTRLIK